ncbi:unnamed protein product, partial [Iphiclides podalirius]
MISTYILKLRFMKCDNNGFDCFKPATADETFGGKRERYAADCDLQLDVTTAVPLSFDRKPVLFSIVPAVEDNSYQFFTHFDSPFMNNMDEIAYWVHTKRAPCLYGFDNTNSKLDEQAHCSKNKPKINDVKEVPSPKKKNKRKLVLDEQVSSTGAVNVADPGENCLVDTSRRKRHTGRYSQSKKSADKSRQSLKRDKSGFAECFSESDDDSELLKQKKFFC